MAISLVTSPTLAHKDHKKKPPAAQVVTAQAQPGASAAPTEATVAISTNPAVAHEQMGEMMESMAQDRSKMTSFERLLDWLGRLHPMIVHFPIAFFPAALFTAVVGKKRPAFGTPVQFLVVAGGIMAPIAALLGWFDAGFDWASDDALLQPHRWLGTFIGVIALGLAIFAWRKPAQDRGPGMIIGLSIITAAIVVQGWFGGALVHGMDHMNW
ncbi:MAG: hypothetical protein M3R03_05130 [Pseudomonadota bacterium]|nr:hypothetical protein [Pseudomonadota bacterium]